MFFSLNQFIIALIYTLIFLSLLVKSDPYPSGDEGTSSSGSLPKKPTSGRPPLAPKRVLFKASPATCTSNQRPSSPPRSSTNLENALINPSSPIKSSIVKPIKKPETSNKTFPHFMNHVGKVPRKDARRYGLLVEEYRKNKVITIDNRLKMNDVNASEEEKINAKKSYEEVKGPKSKAKEKVNSYLERKQFSQSPKKEVLG